MSRTRSALALCILAALATGSADGADKKGKQAGTIKDLEDREIQVIRDPPTDVTQQQAIEQYRRFLELQSQNEKMRAEATRRLGDLQVEVDESARAGGESALSGPELNEAVKLYEGLLAAQPDYERNDAVMYQLARAHEAQAQPEKALAVLNELVAKRPDSQWITEAQFRRGEILFSLGRYRDAERAYAAVTSAGSDSGFYDQGLYKHGWSLFKQSRGEESAASFLRLLDRVLVSEGQLRERDSMSRPERELTDDAMRAMAITFSDLDGPETLDATLKVRGDPLYAHLLYEALGDLYMEKERYQDAARAL